jgi:ribosomal protein S18
MDIEELLNTIEYNDPELLEEIVTRRIKTITITFE